MARHEILNLVQIPNCVISFQSFTEESLELRVGGIVALKIKKFNPAVARHRIDVWQVVAVHWDRQL